MSFEEKLVKIAEREQKVYNSGYSEGQSSMVDPEKVIEKTANGTTTLTIDDVSELPHEVEVQLGQYIEKYKNPTWYDTSLSISYSDIPDGKATNIANDFKIANGMTCRFRFKAEKSDGDVYFRWLMDYVGDPLDVGTRKMSYNNGYYEADFTNNLFGEDITIGNISGYSTEFGYSGDITVTEIEITEPTSMTDFSGISLSVNGETYSSPSNGLIQGIKSYSPNMTFTTDEGLKIEARYHKSWGMQTEYDRFWDAYQDNGNRQMYEGAFSGYGWTKENFKPKYDIIPTQQATNIFKSSTGLIGLDMVELFEELGIVFDISKSASLNGLIQMSYASRWGVFDTRSAATLNYSFGEGYSYLKTIDKVILKDDGSQKFVNTFNYDNALENITFEGVIGQNGFNMQWSTKLSKASITSIINALSPDTSGLTVTLSRQAVISAFGSTTSDEWLNLIATKSNWTISLV
jgi:hypothetical protein